MFFRSISLGLAIAAVLLTQTNSIGQSVFHADGIPTMHGEYVDNQPAYDISTQHNTPSPAYHSGYANSSPAYTHTPFHTNHAATYNSVYPLIPFPDPLGTQHGTRKITLCWTTAV